MRVDATGQPSGMNLGQLAIRGVVGPLFVGHGAQKLFGWFDGHGIEGTGGAFESMGLNPGKRHAAAAGAAEAIGGAPRLLIPFFIVVAVCAVGYVIFNRSAPHIAEDL